MKKLVSQVYKTTEKDADKRKKLFNIIKREAKIHEKMEEKYLYPYLKEHVKSRPNVFEHHEEIALTIYALTQICKAI